MALIAIKFPLLYPIKQWCSSFRKLVIPYVGHLEKIIYVQCRNAISGVLLEAGTRVLAPVYSEHSTRLHPNEVSTRPHVQGVLDNFFPERSKVIFLT